ncbi:hypothetical protein ACFYNO_31190 [Kitasatospora sp. NPDC006697]|uniref:hypothetical protein n=1 Tax=Kitasatospora sp. NPDC006697 TaxID=3364020 RepID=UPI0036AD1C77
MGEELARERGWNFLATAADTLPPASLAFEIDLRTPVSPAEVVRRARAELGVELDFLPRDEGFTAMLALDNLPHPLPPRARPLLPGLLRTIESCRWQGRYRFFPGVPEFAADTDCTALATAALHRHRSLLRSRLAETGRHLLAAGAPVAAGLRPGAVMVYWEDGAEPLARPRGRKHDAVVSANVLRALHLADRRHGPVVEATLGQVEDHLRSGRYLGGTRYYPSPATFLHAAARLCGQCPACAARLGPPLRSACAAHPAPANALDLALLTICARACGLPAHGTHRAALTRLQRPDGAWPAHGYFRTGRLPVYFGSAHLTTVFALRALEPAAAR